MGLRVLVILAAVGGAALVAGYDQAESTWKTSLRVFAGEAAAVAAAEVAPAPGEEEVTPSAEEPEPTLAAPPEEAPAAADALAFSAVAGQTDGMQLARAGGRVLQGANLRAKPDVEAKRIDVVGRDQSLEVTGRSEDRRWYRIRHRGAPAFISAGLVRIEWLEGAHGRVALDEIDRDLDGLAGILERARFRDVIEAAAPIRLRLEQARDWTDVDGAVVRLELMTATAEVALDRNEDASLSLARALAVDGELTLDDRRTPPKLRRLLTAVRRSR